MVTLLTLVHSPLVGPSTWDGMITPAAERGFEVAVPDLTGTVVDGPPYATRQLDVVAESVEQRPTVLVGHSGAGPLLGAIAHAVPSVRGYLFVDAGLPSPDRSWFQTAPPELAGQLRGMATDGWLPPWPQWWAPEVLEQLLPDPDVRARFAEECPRLPLAMFEEVWPSAPGWEHRPGGYLRLSEGYQQPADRARDLSWPVTELAADHLAVLTEPQRVAASVLNLVAQLGTG